MDTTNLCTNQLLMKISKNLFPFLIVSILHLVGEGMSIEMLSSGYKTVDNNLFTLLF